jgi:formylglycine-generating enzyme required for sulfatase activity
MKRFLLFISLLTMLSLILSACGGSATDAPAELEEELIPVTGDATPTAEPEPLQTVDLAGPPMVVGSKYLYVDGTVLIAVPGGPFLMGHNFPDNPEREIVVSDFWIYSTEVTNSQYALCVQAGECSPPDPKNSPTYGDNRYIKFPITGVNHEQATAYCTFVKGRLPTEAEWEKTARGLEGSLFPWGDGSPTCGLLNSVGCRTRTTYINDYPDGQSFYEAWDMAGNVREWVADWYSPTYNLDNPVADPLGPDFGEKRSVRGSSYKDNRGDQSLSALRFSLDPEENLDDLGFRCIVEDPMAFAPWCEMMAYVGMGPDGSEANCTPEVKCNSVSILQSPLCNPQTYTPYTIVSVELGNTPPDGWVYDVPGCSAIPGEQTATKDKFTCQPGAVGPAAATGECVDTLSCVSTCPMYYTKVGDKCVWDGGGTSGTECLLGATYDPLTQCCTADPGSGVDFNLCPAGSYPLNGVCVPNPNAVVDSVSENVFFTFCSPPTTRTPKPGNDPGDDPGGCVPLSDTECRLQNPNAPYFCSSTCSCVSSPDSCP